MPARWTKPSPAIAGTSSSFTIGILAGLRPSIGPGEDTLLVRAYATYGLDNRLFGSQAFRQPLSILVAYMANLEL